MNKKVKKKKEEDDFITRWIVVIHGIVILLTVLSFVFWIGAVYAEMLEKTEELMPGYKQHKPKLAVVGKEYIQDDEPAIQLCGQIISKDLLWNSSIYLISLATLLYMVSAIERHIKATKSIH